MRCLPVLAMLGLWGLVPAQANTLAGLDARLTGIQGPHALARRGPAHPAGEIGLAFGHSVCNTGTVPIAWAGPLDGPAPMQANHPLVAFLVAREADGRLVQITDRRTFVRHEARAANEECGSCEHPGTDQSLGVGCSHVVDGNASGDRFWLGPPDEVQPWLCTWNPVGSHFDRGEPDAGYPANQDGVRSLTAAQAGALEPVLHRITLREADLLTPGNYYYCLQLLAPGEAADQRGDNLGYRRMVPTWDGGNWNFSDSGPFAHGSVLAAWEGATVATVRNGNDDGRLCVGVKVTGPVAGLHHYEYAVHNLDNARGVVRLRIPVCPRATVTAVGFRDVDGEAWTDWTWSRIGDELVFQATGTNQLQWNQLFNFWFDCDLPPEAGPVGLDQALPGPGSLQLSVDSQIPRVSPRVSGLGPGCGSPSPLLAADGVPAPGNAAFGLSITSSPGATMFLFGALRADSQPLGNGCFQYLEPASTASFGLLVADASGRARLPQPVPNRPEVEGVTLHWQAAQLVPGGPLFQEFSLSNGVSTRIGCGCAAPEIVQFTGFETGDFGEFQDVSAGARVQDSVARGGRFAMRCQKVGEGYTHATLMGQTPDGLNSAPLNLTELYATFWFRYSVATQRERIAEVAGHLDLPKARITLEADKVLSIDDYGHYHRYFGTTVLEPDRWYQIRWYVGTGFSARTLLMLDDRVEIDIPDAVLSDQLASRFHIGRSTLSGGIVDCCFDDLVLASGAFVDDGEVALLPPVGAGVYRAWAGSYADVDEWPHDGDWTVNLSTGTGSASTFALQSSTAADVSGRVLAVKSMAALRHTVMTYTPSVVRLRSAGIDADTAAGDGGGYYKLRGKVFPLDPATGLMWTLAGVDGIQVGTVSGSSSTTKLSAAGAAVLFAR